MSHSPPNQVQRPVTAARITDATAAGRDMLTAATAAANVNPTATNHQGPNMSIPKTINDSPTLRTLADGGDWDAIVAAWPVVRLPDVRVSGRETAVGLMAAGHDWFAVSEAFDAHAVGGDLKAIMQSADGINWADDLAVATLHAIESQVITSSVIDTLVGLSVRTEPTPTADEIRGAWAAYAAHRILARKAGVVLEAAALTTQAISTDPDIDGETIRASLVTEFDRLWGVDNA